MARDREGGRGLSSGRRRDLAKEKEEKKVEKATHIQWNLRQGTLLNIFVECKVYTMARI